MGYFAHLSKIMLGLDPVCLVFFIAKGQGCEESMIKVHFTAIPQQYQRWSVTK